MALLPSLPGSSHSYSGIMFLWGLREGPGIWLEPLGVGITLLSCSQVAWPPWSRGGAVPRPTQEASKLAGRGLSPDQKWGGPIETGVKPQPGAGKGHWEPEVLGEGVRERLVPGRVF